MTKLAGYFAILCSLLNYNEAYSQRHWATYFGGEAEDEITDISTAEYGYCITGNTKSQTGIATPNSHQSTYPSSTQNAFLAVHYDDQGTIQLYWSTYIGGNGLDKGLGVVSYWSSIYVVGSTTSTNNIASAGAHQEQLGGQSDGFLMKFNYHGDFQWGTYIGGSGLDEINAVTTDLLGNIYVAGWTESASGIATPNAHQPLHGGGRDAFIAKFDSSGTLLWSTYFGGSGNEEISKIHCRRVYTYDFFMIVGNTSSTNNITTTGSHQAIYGGGISDAFLAKFSLSGMLEWSTYYGGTDEEFGEAVQFDHNSVFICGATSSPNGIATLGAYQSTGADRSAFLVKFDLNGSRQWGTYFRGSGNYNHAFALNIAYLGNYRTVYMSGITNSLKGISNPNNSYQYYFGGGLTDAFYVQFNYFGQAMTGSYYGSLNPEGGQYGTSMINEYEHSYSFVLAGNSWDDFDLIHNLSTVGSSQPNHAGVVDGFIAYFNHAPVTLNENENEGTNVFPNPSHGSFAIKNLNQGEIKIEVFDLMGRLVFCEVKEHVSETVIQTSLSPGVYTIQTTGAFQFTERLIISGKN